ncbi:MAG: hypothetical protein F6K26_26260 [Moorea sp. SIO2I5]|nr:hypothetical protein [Moorena sp. SIO2I5]
MEKLDNTKAITLQELPIIDVSCLYESGKVKEKIKLANMLRKFRMYPGFFYVVNTKLPNEVILKVFEQSKLLFCQTFE